MLNLLDSPHRHAFHNVELNPRIRHARHALAMDEARGPFTPTLWADWAPDQDVKQVWFPGSHLDVGGYYPDRGLSDGPLLWMIEEAHDAVGLVFHQAMVDQIRPDPLGVLHDDNRDVLGAFALLYGPLIEHFLEPLTESQPRAIPPIDPRAPSPWFDRSVYERHQRPPIGTAPYRPTRVLAPGEAATVSVVAREPWNATGLYLEAGDYTFAATGEWLNVGIASGPAGTTALRQFRPSQAGRLVGTAIGLGERLFRRLTSNQRANFLFSRREEHLPWMSLVGVVANNAVPVKGALSAHERIPIGAGMNHRVSKAGYLYAFANDAWGFYHNNRGNVSLTVTRTA
ncbi:MAG: phospholipase effector Tle1 domain-containing protein [Pseudonocardiaceae bacterium]